VLAQAAKTTAALEAEARDLKIRLYDLSTENVSGASAVVATFCGRSPPVALPVVSACRVCSSPAQHKLTDSNAKLAEEAKELMGYVTQLQEKCGLL
jgi:hypothetical protein